MAASLGSGVAAPKFVADLPASAIDDFVIDKFIRTRGTKFFIDDHLKFSGRID